MNELFSFREELTDREIGQFVNELSEAVLERVSIRCLKWHQRKYMNIHGASC